MKFFLIPLVLSIAPVHGIRTLIRVGRPSAFRFMWERVCVSAAVAAHTHVHVFFTTQGQHHVNEDEEGRSRGLVGTSTGKIRPHWHVFASVDDRSTSLLKHHIMLLHLLDTPRMRRMGKGMKMMAKRMGKASIS